MFGLIRLVTNKVDSKIKATRFLRKVFVAVKGLCIRYPSFPVFRFFFFVANLADQIFSTRRLKKAKDREIDIVWKYVYLLRFGTKALFRVRTDAPVAENSSDHKWPRGTLFDNSVNRDFNKKVYYMFGFRNELRVLDLGCSGGGMVRSFIEDGHTAIGIEGSDYSKKLRSGEWDTCPHHLFTSDITKPFYIEDASGKAQTFDLITSWEVLEHIAEADIDALIANIERHLSKDGCFVGSVATFRDENPLTGAVYHVTLKPKSWWLDRFKKFGLIPLENHPLQTEDFVRGNGLSLHDWSPEDGSGFHLVLKKA